MRARAARMRRRLRGSAPTRITPRAVLSRRVRGTQIDFRSLALRPDLTQALADAFWHHVGVRNPRCILVLWAHLRVFAQFAAESGGLTGLADMHHGLLVRYIEWLNARRRATGQPWTKSSRSGAYTTLRKLLQWLERCRPGVLEPLEYPYNPFPWRNRDTAARAKLPAAELRAILKACEHDIAAIRARRAGFAEERAAASCDPATRAGSSRMALIASLEQRYEGVIPSWSELRRRGDQALLRSLRHFGGARTIGPLLYPDARSVLPYYLAILIHTAGNPEPIAALTTDCLQPIPLLEDRQLLVWAKHRAAQSQRRSFRSNDPDEPPALVRELLDYTALLRSKAPAAVRDRLFLYRGVRGITALSTSRAKVMIRSDFTARHALAHFSLASIRPGVLSAFYRASGDLMQVKAVANHRSIATTVRYVDTPQVQAEHRVRVAALQSTFLGHIEGRGGPAPRRTRVRPRGCKRLEAVPAVSMFGFDCQDPFAGIAPGSRRGQLCTHFLGCFTCPNAIIPDDPRTLARLLQAREHLSRSAESIHPARWQAIYAPPLQILEHDILPRFSAAELAAAHSQYATLPPLPPLR